MNTHSDFAATYRGLPDSQLLKIANDGDLVEEASLAITQELHRRNLKRSDVRKHLESPKEKLQKEVQERWFPLANHMGFGLYGKDYLTEADRLANIQARTKFFVVGIPLIPIASYRLQCAKDRRGWFQDDSDDEVLSRVPLLWSQVIVTWVKTVLLMAATIGLIFFVDRIWHSVL